MKKKTYLPTPFAMPAGLSARVLAILTTTAALWFGTAAAALPHSANQQPG